MSWHQLKAKYSSTCYDCKKYFNQGTLIFWDDSSRKVKHVKCELEVKSKIYNPLLLQLIPFLRSYPIDFSRQNSNHDHKQIKNYIAKDDSLLLVDETIMTKDLSEFEARKQAREFQRDLNGQ